MNRWKSGIAGATLAMAVVAGAAAPAYADVTFLLGNNPQPGEENILFGAKETGTTITGATNQSNVPVVFTSTDTLLQNSSGQAQILNNAGGNLTDIAVSAPGYTFTDFIVDLNKAGTTQNPNPIDVSVLASDGTFTFTVPGGPGSNFLTILATNNETMSSVSFSSDGGWEQFKQPRISGVAAVPELSTWAMMGSASRPSASQVTARGRAASASRKRRLFHLCRAAALAALVLPSERLRSLRVEWIRTIQDPISRRSEPARRSASRGQELRIDVIFHGIGTPLRG